MKVSVRSISCILIFSFVVVVLMISFDYHSNLAKAEKPAVCDPEDKSVNSTESKIYGVPTTSEIGANTIIRK
ncbi:MAG TPA: hypothetical protein VH500_11855 [Nitrososphaeraceae archaeon]